MLTAAAAEAFVGGLALPEPHEYASLTETVLNAESAFPGAVAALEPTPTTGKSAVVNAGSLTSFVEGVDPSLKTDVMNSTLLAQLAANKARDRYKQPRAWFDYYKNVLENIGWNAPGFAFDKYTSGGSTVNMDKAVLEILGAICTGNEIAVMAATMNALKNLPAGSPQITIWNANASDGAAGNFQILPCAQTPNGNVVMVMDAMQFNARVSHGQFLWWTWSSTEIDIDRAAFRLELNTDVYSKIRSDVSTKLGDRAKSFIKALPDI
jgi:hypothetical protein